jgi:hypothetical protein
MSSRRVAHDEIVKLIKQSNPEFGNATEELIEKQDNRSELYCYILKYRYGDIIIDSNGLRLPEGISEDLEQDILKDISKASNNIPFGIILENNAEVSLNNKLNIPKSLAILTESQPIGSYEAADFMRNLSYGKSTINYRPPWQVVAGVRSIFLPGLFSSAQVKNNLDDLLRNLDLNGLEYYKQKFPSFDEDIFPFARDIINSKSSGIDDWNTTLMIFPDRWLETIKSGITTFHQYIYNAAWNQSEHFRNKEAIVSQLSEYLQYYQGTQAYTCCMEVLLDLFEIGLGHQHCYQIVEENSLQLNGPFPKLIELLQVKLDMNQNSFLMLEPTYIQPDSAALEKKKYFYSATSIGKVLSTLGRDTHSPPNLSNLLFSPLNKVLNSPAFLKDFENTCKKKLSFQLYGKNGARRGKFDIPDVREIFIFLEDRQRNINYTHAFLRGCIKIEFIDE